MRISTIIYVVLINIKIWFLKFLRLDKYIMPYKTLINLTDLCNSRCSYCNIWKTDKKNDTHTIGMRDLSLFFDDMGDNLVWLALSGGEVTLFSHFKEMIKETKRKCKKLRIVSFTTNGLNPDKALEFAKFVKDNNFDVIVSISLDGAEELHDQLRGVKGNYKKCMLLYEMLQRESIPVHFGITIGEKNVSFIQKEYSKRKHEIKAVTFVHSGGIYNKENNENMERIINGLNYINKFYSIDHVSEIIEKIHIKTAIRFIQGGMRENIIPCEVLNTSIHIMPDGGIYPCMYLEKIGDIRNDKVSELMKSKFIDSIKSDIRDNKCPHCWMNCYSPFSIMQHPFKSLRILINYH